MCGAAAGEGRGGFSDNAAFQSTCCQLLPKAHICRYYFSSAPALLSSLFGVGRRQAPADSCALRVSLTAAFSWGEIKRLGGCGHVLASGDGDNA